MRGGSTGSFKKKGVKADKKLQDKGQGLGGGGPEEEGRLGEGW